MAIVAGVVIGFVSDLSATISRMEKHLEDMNGRNSLLQPPKLVTLKLVTDSDKWVSVFFAFTIAHLCQHDEREPKERELTEIGAGEAIGNSPEKPSSLTAGSRPGAHRPRVGSQLSCENGLCAVRGYCGGAGRGSTGHGAEKGEDGKDVEMHCVRCGLFGEFW